MSIGNLPIVIFGNQNHEILRTEVLDITKLDRLRLSAFLLMSLPANVQFHLHLISILSPSYPHLISILSPSYPHLISTLSQSYLNLISILSPSYLHIVLPPSLFFSTYTCVSVCRLWRVHACFCICLRRCASSWVSDGRAAVKPLEVHFSTS